MSATAKRLSLQFSTRTLLALVAVIAIASLAANWSYRRAVLRSAVASWKQATANCGLSVGTHAAVCAASEEWLDAELRVPFADTHAARRAHLERVQAIRDQFDKEKDVTMWGDRDTPVQIMQEIDGYRDRALEGVR